MKHAGVKDRTVLVVGPIPPPLHGYSLVTAAMIESLKKVTAVEVIDIAPKNFLRGWRYHYHRLVRNGRALRAIFNRPRGRQALYLAGSGGAGVLYDLLLVLAARACEYRLYIHHHAFAYLDRRSQLTAALIALAGAEATHICLCPTMERRIREQYPRVSRTAILSNAAFVTPSDSLRVPGSGPMRIGFLSNLIPDKGLDTVIEIFRSVRQNRRNVELVIAGPTAGPESQALINRAKDEFADAFDYRGALYGKQKTAFFCDVDVFLFPTRYANEAEPLVVLEALAAGVPVVSTPRGCIPDDLTSGGIVLDGNADFTAAATALISDWSTDTAHVADLAAAAHDRSLTLHQAAQRELNGLLALIIGERMPS